MAKSETNEQQQSIFYVVWPEDRSPATAATAPTAANLISMNPSGTQGIGSAAGSLTPIETLLPSSSASTSIYTGLVSSPAAVVPGAGLGSLPMVGATAAGLSPTAASRPAAPASGTEESDSSDAGSPVPSTGQQQSITTAPPIGGEVQTVTITDTGEFSGNVTPITTASTHNLLISSGPRSHPFGLTTNGSGVLSTVYNPVSSSGVIYVSDGSSSMLARSHPLGPPPPPTMHRGNSGGSIITGPGPAMLLHQMQERPQKHKLPPSTEPPPLKCIGEFCRHILARISV